MLGRSILGREQRDDDADRGIVRCFEGHALRVDAESAQHLVHLEQPPVRYGDAATDCGARDVFPFPEGSPYGRTVEGGTEAEQFGHVRQHLVFARSLESEADTVGVEDGTKRHGSPMRV